MPRRSEYVPPSDSGKAAPPIGVQELALTDPRRVGLSYAIPRAMRLAVANGEPVLRFGSAFAGTPPYRRAPPTASALDAVMPLASESEEPFARAVLQVARRWGPMELCEHDRPRFHASCNGHQIDRSGPVSWQEPVAPWRRYARSAKAILSILAALTEPDGVGSPEDWWNVAWGRRDWTPAANDGWRSPTGVGLALPSTGLPSEMWPPRVPERRDEAAMWLGVCVQNWLTVAGVRPELRTDTPRRGQPGDAPQWVATLALGSLPSRLAGELVAALVGGAGGYRCDGCGRPYTVPAHGRRPALSSRRRHYCISCRSGGRYPAAKRAWEHDHAADRQRARAHRRTLRRAASSGGEAAAPSRPARRGAGSA